MDAVELPGTPEKQPCPRALARWVSPFAFGCTPLLAGARAGLGGKGSRAPASDCGGAGRAGSRGMADACFRNEHGGQWAFVADGMTRGSAKQRRNARVHRLSDGPPIDHFAMAECAIARVIP